MEKEYNIYTLTCPTTNNIFYVGRTNGKLKNRLTGHLKDNVNREKKKVINEILEKDKLPIIESIDVCTKSDVYKLEIFWINLIKTWGFNLTNLVHINRSYHNSKLYLKRKTEYVQLVSNRPSESHVYRSINKTWYLKK